PRSAARVRQVPPAARTHRCGRRAHAPLAGRRTRVPRLPRQRGTRARPARRSVARGREFGVAMSYKTCPDWPELMELAPELQFKPLTVADAQLPVEVLTSVSHVSLGEVEICCDLDHHVFFAKHTDPEIAAALAGTHWFEVREWATSGPGTSSNAAYQTRT